MIAEWVQATSVEAITEAELRECIEERACVEETDYDLGRIEREVKDVRLHNSTKDASFEKQVWRFCQKYTTTMRKCGYEKFVEKKPKIAIKHLMTRMNH